MFLLPDELFVSEAFLVALGRPADPAGYLAYLRALRAGLTRVRLVSDLLRSSEGQALRSVYGGPGVATDLWPEQKPRRRHGLRAPSDKELFELRPDVLAMACRDFFGSDVTNAVGTLEERVRHVRKATPWRQRCWPALRSWKPTPNERRKPVVDARQPTWTAVLPPLDDVVFVTIATASYMPFVRVLMASLRHHHPNAGRVLLLVDERLPTDSAVDACVVPASSMELPNFDDMTMRYDVVELSTALKPYVVRWLFQQTGARRIIYLDPDTRCEAPLDEALALLNGSASVVLTPHLTEPLPADDGMPDDHTVLRSGVFNLGFAGFARCSETLGFLDWWAARLATGALVDFANNLFTDQRWCDLAPAFLSRLHVLRSVGYNVAYWNLPHRRIERDGKRWTVNGQALVFFHFSGVDPDSPGAVSKYQSRPLVAEQPALEALFADYAGAVHASGWDTDKKIMWRYGTEDGVDLSPTLRTLYRLKHPKPTLASRLESTREMLDDCMIDSSTGLSPLMRSLHGLRSDLRVHFNLAHAQGRRAYSGWFWAVGTVEHGLGSIMRRHHADAEAFSAGRP